MAQQAAVVANGGETTLTPRQRRALEYVADDTLSDVQISANLKIGENTLTRWKRLPAFQAAVDVVAERQRAKLHLERVANKQNRIDAHNEIDRRLWSIADARATDPLMAGVAGGDSGFMVRTLKVSPGAEPVEEFQFDKALVDSIRANMEQAAKELGQWDDKAPVDLTQKLYIGIVLERV